MKPSDQFDSDALEALLDASIEFDRDADARHSNPDRFVGDLARRLEARTVVRVRTMGFSGLAAAVALALTLFFVLGTKSDEVPFDRSTPVVVTNSEAVEEEYQAWSDDLETRAGLGDLDALVVLSELDALETDLIDEFLDTLFEGV